jgi:hypothetical protein
MNFLKVNELQTEEMKSLLEEMSGTILLGYFLQGTDP